MTSFHQGHNLLICKSDSSSPLLSCLSVLLFQCCCFFQPMNFMDIQESLVTTWQCHLVNLFPFWTSPNCKIVHLLTIKFSYFFIEMTKCISLFLNEILMKDWKTISFLCVSRSVLICVKKSFWFYPEPYQQHQESLKQWMQNSISDCQQNKQKSFGQPWSN